MKKINYTCFLFLVLLLSGCEKWLDVRPETEVNEDDMFLTEQGFMDALYGVYVNMGKEDLYGGQLPTALDMTAQLYDYYDLASCTYGRYSTFEYEHPQCTRISDRIWMRLYYCIGLANNLLKYLDAPEAENICPSYNYIKGEALALRAYLHFEAVRMFAPDIKDKPDYLSIPYRTVFTPEIDPQLTVKEVYAHILQDLESARKLLEGDVVRTNAPEWLGNNKKAEESEDVTEQNNVHYVQGFLKDRKYRMNYYAVTATLARVYITMGENEKAYQYAMEVIESGKYRPIQESDIQKDSEFAKLRDILFTDEFIFGLSSLSVDAFYKSNFDESYSPEKVLVRSLREIYGSGTNDIRQTHWFKSVWGTNYLLKHQNSLQYSKDRIRMITLPEMYYIAAEAHPGEAASLLDKILPSRNIHTSLGNGAGRQEVLVEVLKEYRKEYIGEGMFFYACKRLMGEETVMQLLNIGIPGQDKVLVWPLPMDEIKYGDRKSEIWKNDK